MTSFKLLGGGWRDALVAIVLIAGLCFVAAGARAQDAVWMGTVGDSNFNTAGNWSPTAVPTGLAQFVLPVATTNVNMNQAWTLGEFLFGGTSAPSITINSVAVGVNNGIVSGSYAPVFFLNGSASLNTGGSLANANITVNSTSSVVHSTLQLQSGDGGTATITNNGVVALTGTSVLDSATVTNSSTIPIIGLLPVGYSGSVTAFYDNSTGGNARLINNSVGTFDFSMTTGQGGIHQVNAGSIEGGGQIFLGANQLTIGGNNLSTTFSGVISDCGNSTCLAAQLGNPAPSGGALAKIGTGTLTLTGTNTYTGATAVNAGTLEVDGSIASSSAVVVTSGGTLSGTGIVDPVTTTIMSGGTLAPGSLLNPTGTLTVTGNLAFQSGALYLVQVTPSAASSAVVSGTASLAGTVQASFASGSYLSRQYDILKSAGLNGTSFAALATSNLPAGFSASLSYSATDVFLDISGSGGGLSTIAGFNINQQNVATALNNFFNSGGALPPQFVTVFGLTGSTLGTALTQLSGETATAVQQTTYDAMGQFMGLLTDPMADCASLARRRNQQWDSSCPDAVGKRTDALAMSTKAPLGSTLEPRWSVWAAGFGGSRSTDGNAGLGSNDATSNVYGTAIGADYRLSPTTVAGFAVAGGGTSFSVANGGSGRSDLFQAGTYLRHTDGPAYLSAALAYGWQDVTTNRVVTVAGVDQLQAQFDANAWSGRIEGGYRLVPSWAGGVGVTPYAAAQLITVDLPAYAENVESGSSAFALAYGAKDATDPRFELGVRSDRSFAMEDGVFTLRGRLAWAHDDDPNRAIGATFQALPGASFIVNGAAQASDSALTTAAAEMKWRNGWSAAATFEGDFSNVTRSYAAKGFARYTW